jgi:hypothetical protein
MSVISINHVVYTRLGTMSPSYQRIKIKELGNPPKSKFPNGSQGPALQAD